MRRLLIVMALVTCATSYAELQNVAGIRIRHSPQLLPFNEWKALSGEWTEEDGEIVGRAKEGEMGWLLYQKNDFCIGDFSLSLEFKTPEPANGGVQFRAHWLPKLPAPDGVAADQAPKQMYGFQANIDTSKKDGTGALMVAHGEPPLASPSAEAQAAVKPAKWNKMLIEAKGDTLSITINGVPAATVTDDRFIYGTLALQVVGNAGKTVTEIRYRKIALAQPVESDTWRPLFDGKTLNGWKQWGSESWTVEDGVIHGSSGPKKSEGYLATEETWKDFHVIGMFKILGEGNYGLFYHSTIKYNEEQYPVISGLQGEVDPTYPGPTGWVYESYKRGWLVKPDPSKMEAYALRPGDWNAMEIRSVGNHVTTWVNGIRVLDLLDAGQQLFEGAFALQLHTGGATGILWKNLYVKK